MYTFFCYAANEDGSQIVDNVNENNNLQEQDIKLNEGSKIDDLIQNESIEDNKEIAKEYMKGLMPRFLFFFNLLFGFFGWALLSFFISNILDIKKVDGSYTKFLIVSPIPHYLYIAVFALILGLIYNYKRVFKDYLFFLCYTFLLTMSCHICFGFSCKAITADKGSNYLSQANGKNDYDANLLYVIPMLITGLTTFICFAIFFEELYIYKTYFMYTALVLFILHLILVVIDCFNLVDDYKPWIKLPV